MSRVMIMQMLGVFAGSWVMMILHNQKDEMPFGFFLAPAEDRVA